MKLAMITGCVGGIGRASAEKLLKNGWFVVGMGRTAPAADDSLSQNPNFAFYRGDVSNREDREGFLNFALEQGHEIRALVNVAGVAPKVRMDLLEMTEESYDRVMDINTKGTLFLTQAVAKQMVHNTLENGVRGSICNISSMSAYTSSVSRGEYCISKAGVSMITTLFADRLAEYGIMVNEIRPGIIATGMTAAVQEKYDKLIDGGLLPIKRWGMPEDVASAVYALCGGALPYMTGQSLDVDGGFHIRRL